METIPPCCPRYVTDDAAYQLAQAEHVARQSADPDHDGCPSVCCCWDCAGWEARDPDRQFPADIRITGRDTRRLNKMLDGRTITGGRRPRRPR